MSDRVIRGSMSDLSNLVDHALRDAIGYPSNSAWSVANVVGDNLDAIDPLDWAKIVERIEFADKRGVLLHGKSGIAIGGAADREHWLRLRDRIKARLGEERP